MKTVIAPKGAARLHYHYSDDDGIVIHGGSTSLHKDVLFKATPRIVIGILIAIEIIREDPSLCFYEQNEDGASMWCVYLNDNGDLCNMDRYGKYIQLAVICGDYWGKSYKVVPIEVFKSKHVSR